MKAKEVLRNIYPILILTLVVAISVNILNLTDQSTRHQIEAQQKAKIERLLVDLYPDMNRFELNNDIYTIYSNGDEVGYALIAIGKGYGGDINILVGLKEDKTTLQGITIVSQTETPGLGTRVTESSFTDQFAGLSINDVALMKDGGQVDAITGSTISSTAVVNAVRATVMEKMGLTEGIQ